MGGHYERGLFQQVEELTLENERLREENKRLRRENRQLREENAQLKKRLKNLEATVEEAVAKATEPLLAKIAERDQEILRLKAQLAKDSSNSSKLSSNNGFKKIPNNREKSEKKPGGQPGHKGNRLNIPENLEELVEQGKAQNILSCLM